jgi:proline iminopeptidase
MPCPSGRKKYSDERKAILAHNLEQLQADFNAAPASHSFAIYYRANVPRFFSNPSFDVQELLEGVENGAGLDQLAASLPNRAQVRQALEGLEMPALVVHGRHDYSIPYPVWEELINGLDNITFRLIDESSHNPQMEHPELFDQELISWFESH